jgi:hypothetical protein
MAKTTKKKSEITKKKIKEAMSNIRCVIASCEEGLDGRWDCSTEEGKETGFPPMIELLQEVEAVLSKVKVK